ncbi:MAG TPA: peptidoglycan bridge formation glycyltransferase FemA/FemB family protein, partial [Anaerolineaceae bacterium]|nr:peptidoglycan bridge formation glycyltransferase FemA/FemB family protein [Anaerolineaceae bacterium]
MSLLTADQWDQFLAQQPEAHLLQTRPWGEVKSAFGWSAARVSNGTAGAQVLFRRLPLGLSVAYIPKGPVGSGWQSLWPEIDALCRRQRAVFLKVEPDAWEPLRSELAAEFAGFTPSAPIQPRRTVVVSLEGSEDDWLARMKQKTRYNIRLAERKDVRVEVSDDAETFSRLMQVTGERDHFGVHSPAYYRKTFETFSSRGQCALLVARYAGQPLAALMIFCSGSQAWYFYGASGDEERNRMPTYLLQWEAMRWAAAQGCRTYDLYGIPDVDEDRLESEFAGRGDGLWGVYRFKRGFGGEVRRSVGDWDRGYQPLAY